ncbi:YhcN/YlaJ family sporulation lipoprotein [Paenibacillus sp. CMAA1364]
MRTKTVSVSLLSAALIMGMTVTGLTGCGTKSADNQNVTTKSVRNHTNSMGKDHMNRYGVNSVKDDNNLITRSDNRMGNLRYSEELSNKISSMKEVGMAKVMITNNNAYVAVSIKDSTNMHGMSTKPNNMGKVNNGTTPIGSTGRDGSMGGDMTGAPTRSQSSSNMTTPSQPYYSTNNNQGYGMMSTEEPNITSEIKNRIADMIKKNDTSIKNVYVSANPDFVERIGNYATDVTNGHPMRGMADEFQSLVNRIFPTPSGDLNMTDDHKMMNPMGR